MSWAKLDDRLHSHPKAVAAGLEAMGFWCLALSHCGAYLTDGHMPRASAQRIAGSAEMLDRLSGVLVRVGLWELHPSGDGWQFHDYLDCNKSRAELEANRAELSEKRAEAGRRGAAARWHGNADGNLPPDNDGNGQLAADGPVPSRPDPDPEPNPEPGRGRERERTPAPSPPVASGTRRERAVRGETGEKKGRASRVNREAKANQQAPPEGQKDESQRNRDNADPFAREDQLVRLTVWALQNGEALPANGFETLKQACARRPELLAPADEAVKTYNALMKQAATATPSPVAPEPP